MAGRIEFLGARPHAEMPGLLCSGDLAVFPSLVEATSVAALECMACGLPVAASAVGGLPQIVDDSVGGLFRRGIRTRSRRRWWSCLATGGWRGGGGWGARRWWPSGATSRLVDRHEEVYGGLVGGMGDGQSQFTLWKPHITLLRKMRVGTESADVAGMSPSPWEGRKAGSGGGRATQMLRRLRNAIVKAARNPVTAWRMLWPRYGPFAAKAPDTEFRRAIRWSFGDLEREPLNAVFPGIEHADVRVVRSYDREPLLSMTPAEVLAIGAMVRVLRPERILEKSAPSRGTRR